MKYIYKPQIDENLATVHIPNEKKISNILSEKSRQITSGEGQQNKNTDTSVHMSMDSSK